MALDVRGLTPLLQVYDMPTSVRFYRDVRTFAIRMDTDCVSSGLLNPEGAKIQGKPNV
jgi:hypothetical protein